MTDFKIAIGWLNEGKKIKRAAWCKEAFLHKSKDSMFFNKEDYEAIDWEVCEEEHKTLSDKIDYTSKLGDAIPVQDIKKAVNRLKQRIPKIMHPTNDRTMFGYLEEEMIWKEINIVFGDALSEVSE